MAQRPSSAHSSVSSLSQSSSAISLPRRNAAGPNPQAPSPQAHSTPAADPHQPNLPAARTIPPSTSTSTAPAPTASASSNLPSTQTQATAPPSSGPATTVSNVNTTGTANISPAVSATPASSASTATTSSSTNIPKRSRYAQYFDNWWAWEILAALLGTACILGIVILLAVYDDRPQPDLRWGITLNALVALITTVMKGALMTPLMEGMSQMKWVVFAKESRPLLDFDVYDSASRGGMSAWTLLWHMRKRLWREATAFAVLFYLLSFGIDTFVQQLIQTDVRDDIVATSSAVTLRYAQRYDSFDQQASNQGSIAPDAPDADMVAAIYTPLYATMGTDTSGLFTCPESNCTYPTTPSLAICGACHDLSSKLTKPDDDSYTFNGGPNAGGVVAMNVTSTMEPSRTNSFKDQVALIATFAYVNWTNEETYGVDDPPKAGECALFPCVQEYSANVTRGILNQAVTRQWSTVAPRRITNDTSQATGQWDYYDDIHIPTPGMAGSSAGRDFNMSITAFLGLQKALVPLLNGSTVVGTSGGVELGVIATSPIIQRMYATSNVTEYIQRIAASMTSSIRRHPATKVMVDLPPPSESVLIADLTMPQYPGQALRQLPFVRIEWAWIALPASVVLFSNLFLIFAMVKTKWTQRQLGIGVWKSSSLPLLYHGLDAGAVARANIDPAMSTSIAFMEENAGQLRVRLHAAGNDVHLS